MDCVFSTSPSFLPSLPPLHLSFPISLQSVLSSSKSQLWTGVSDSTRDIPATLASLLILDLNTIDGSGKYYCTSPPHLLLLALMYCPLS